MLKPRIFVDTSVIGGCYDEEFEVHSRLLFDEFRSGKAIAVVSSLTLEELGLAPARVRDVLPSIQRGAIEVVDLDEDAVRLADEYLSSGIVGPGSLVDA